MPSLARGELRKALDAFQAAADTPEVRKSDEVGALLRRGLTVTGFNLLETFLSSRLAEIASYLNTGSVQFVDLPDKLQARAIRNTLEVATAHSRRLGNDPADLRPFSQDVGISLTAVNASIRLSPLMWMWPGSNLAVADYSKVLGAFHVNHTWQVADAVAKRFGFSQSGLQAVLFSLISERHRCAHEASYSVTPLWLRTVPESVLCLAASFDALVSVAATRLRAGESAFLTDDKAMTDSSIRFRYIRERPKGAAELAENAKRASKLGANSDTLFSEAAGRCATNEVLVRQTVAGAPVAWVIPAVG